jgi:hypothetical protein
MRFAWQRQTIGLDEKHAQMVGAGEAIRFSQAFLF